MSARHDGENARARSGHADATATATIPCRRPIEPDEVPALVALGAHLANARHAAGLTVAELADRAQLSPGHVRRLERGERRTRATTLARLAAALDPTHADDLAATLTAVAGAALAPESPFAERIARRRERRHRARSKPPAANVSDLTRASTVASEAVALVVQLDALDLDDPAGLDRFAELLEALEARLAPDSRNAARARGRSGRVGHEEG